MRPADPRIAEILVMIQRVAHGDLHARVHTSEAKDNLDAIAEGLNMLAEEIAASTVSIHRYRVIVSELRTALDDVKTLSGLLPVCAWCKQVRDDEGYWIILEQYVAKHSEARFTHGICPACISKEHKNESRGRSGSEPG